MGLPADDDASERAKTRDVARSRRKRAVRASSVSVKRLPKRELALGLVLYPPDEHVARPRTRGDCAEGARPCPFVSCVHHLYLDVSASTGAIKLNFPDLEPDELAESCSLDVADRGGTTLEEVGEKMNLTRERVRQIEVGAMAACAARKEMFVLRDLVDAGPPGKRRLPVLPASEDDEDDEDFESEFEGADARDDFDVEAFAGDELDAE